MRIEDRLDRDTRNKLNVLRNHEKKSKKSRRNHQDKLSDRDIKELMGVNRPTYKRFNGAFRQK